MREDIKVRRKKNIDYIKGKKENCPCADCGCSYPGPVMEYHHLDGRDKDPNFGLRQMKTWGKQRIDEELSKCIILCANCHRMRHLSDLDPAKYS
jgi:hypothetical protein